MTGDPTQMRLAIRLAVDNVAAGIGGPFGAVVSRDGEVVATGTNRVTSTLDPTAHAEVVAIRAACTALSSFSLDGCELYASCEPCPLCYAAALWARVDRIWYAGSRHDAAAAGFDDSVFYDELALPVDKRRVAVTPLLAEEASGPFAAWAAKTDRTPY
jgi:guanine deaminase